MRKFFEVCWSSPFVKDESKKIKDEQEAPRPRWWASSVQVPASRFERPEQGTILRHPIRDALLEVAGAGPVGAISRRVLVLKWVTARRWRPEKFGPFLAKPNCGIFPDVLVLSSYDPVWQTKAGDTGGSTSNNRVDLNNRPTRSFKDIVGHERIPCSQELPRSAGGSSVPCELAHESLGLARIWRLQARYQHGFYRARYQPGSGSY